VGSLLRAAAGLDGLARVGGLVRAIDGWGGAPGGKDDEGRTGGKDDEGRAGGR